MRKTTILLLVWALVNSIAFAKQANLERNAIQVASTTVVVPTSANAVGATGSTFQTRISIFNPTLFAYPIQVTFYDQSGNMAMANINMSSGQLRVYDNFLGDVFSATGAGTLKFESEQIAGGSPDFQFVVNAEVWTISAGGRYGTSVTTIIGGASAAESYSPGIRVDSDFRSNVGCFNDSSSTNTIVADVFDASGNLVTTVMLIVPPNAWSQTAIPANVASGYVRFRPAGSAYCWAVAVNNTTNDGHFVLASEYVP
jgi:hypothetical protein